MHRVVSDFSCSTSIEERLKIFKAVYENERSECIAKKIIFSDKTHFQLSEIVTIRDSIKNQMHSQRMTMGRTS